MYQKVFISNHNIIITQITIIFNLTVSVSLINFFIYLLVYLI